MTDESEVIKVLIVNDEGQYLAGSGTYWEFTDDRTRARVFDYIGDHVAEQIDLVRRVHGLVWIAVRLDPSEAYEFCDRCGARIVNIRAWFDGRNFYCSECRKTEP